jgi:hypothetical protein
MFERHNRQGDVAKLHITSGGFCGPQPKQGGATGQRRFQRHGGTGGKRRRKQRQRPLPGRPIHGARIERVYFPRDAIGVDDHVDRIGLGAAVAQAALARAVCPCIDQ